MEIAGSNLTEDQLEDMLEQGQGAQLVSHVHIEGDTDQLRQTINNIENRHEIFLSFEKGHFMLIFDIVNYLSKMVSVSFDEYMTD